MPLLSRYVYIREAAIFPRAIPPHEVGFVLSTGASSYVGQGDAWS